MPGPGEMAGLPKTPYMYGDKSDLAFSLRRDSAGKTKGDTGPGAPSVTGTATDKAPEVPAPVQAAVKNMQQMYAQLEKAASAAEFEAGVQQARGHFDTALACYQQAILLNLALGKDITTLTTAMNSLPEQQEQSRVAKYPALGRMVNQQLRNISITDAVELLAAISGMSVNIVPGSLADTASLTPSDTLANISYLDLRNANVAQALNMVLNGNNLAWTVTGNEIVVASTRRLAATSSWVYPVHYLQKPATSQDEYLLNADKFLRGARLALGTGDDTASVFYLGENSNLLVTGNSTTHARMDAYLQALHTGTDMSAFVTLDITDNGNWAQARAAREAQRANLQLLQELQQDAQKRANIYLIQRANTRNGNNNVLRVIDFKSLDYYGWRLLASVTTADLDIEALGNIETIWYQPRVAELFASNMLPFARSAWQIQSAAAKMPKNADLAKLAARSRELMAPVAAKMTNFNGMDTSNLLASDYLLLAGLFTDAQRAEMGKAGADKVLPRALADPSKENLVALQGTLDNMGQGQNLEDNLMLTAQIAQKQGGPLAQALREKLTDIVKGHPVNSSLLLLVNDLTK